MGLLHDSVTSTVYNVIANIISLVVGLVGSIALARLLEPEVFGVFAFVISVVQLTMALLSPNNHRNKISFLFPIPSSKAPI